MTNANHSSNFGNSFYVDEAIRVLEERLSDLRKARELLKERDVLLADLEILDHRIAQLTACLSDPGSVKKASKIVGGGKRGPKATPLEFNGRSQTLNEWAAETGLAVDTIRCRLKRGWSVEKTLTEKNHDKPALKLVEPLDKQEAASGPSVHEESDVIHDEAESESSDRELLKSMGEAAGNLLLAHGRPGFCYKCKLAELPGVEVCRSCGGELENIRTGT